MFSIIDRKIFEVAVVNLTGYGSLGLRLDVMNIEVYNASFRKILVLYHNYSG